jgi:hypothetical protein
MYSDHLHVGFYVSCTSTDIGRVQSWSIANLLPVTAVTLVVVVAAFVLVDTT